ncbi:MAG TPA: polysaccharide deacetylase family protein [Virgibacillus sp.]|nr:polysaccharide deacetylase family protein [Virgibacillus sp.]
MHRYRYIIHVCLFVIIVLLTFQTNYSPLTSHHPELITQSIHVTKSNDPLYKEIQKKSASYYEKPQNAYIDKVWKKTPGRNGIKVNINKSFEKMNKEDIFNESLLVYEEVPPEITLKDLPASPIYRGHPDKDMVAFLINVSWGEEFIPEILTVLKEYHLKATFFIEGKWAKENANYVKMIDEQGHVIGNHAYNHPDMARLSQQEINEQIVETNNIIKAIVGKEPRLFAPPSGSFNDEVVKQAHELNMETILWTVDTIDWKNPSVDVMINRVMSNIHQGAMILMHPTSPVANGLSMLIEDIKSKDYRIGTVDQLLSEER